VTRYKVGDRVVWLKHLAGVVVQCEHPVYWVQFDEDDGEETDPTECDEPYLKLEGAK
jgi:hypothetical protein